MTKDEALTLALELFEQFGRDSRLKYEHQAIYKTIVAIKEALAQPEQRSVSEQQEPVSWKPDRSGKYLTVVYRDLIPGDEVGEVIDHPKAVIMSWSNAVHDVQQLSNTTSPQRKPLTDEEIAEFAERMEASDPTDSFWREFARAIEAAHGIKE